MLNFARKKSEKIGEIGLENLKRSGKIILGEKRQPILQSKNASFAKSMTLLSSSVHYINLTNCLDMGINSLDIRTEV